MCWLSDCAEEGLVVLDMPDWTTEDAYSKAQACLMLKTVLRHYETVVFAFMLPYEYLDNSPHNIATFTSLLEYIGKPEDLGENVIVVLSKIEEPEESREMFIERIEEMAEESEEIGELLSNADRLNQVLVFENKAYQVEDRADFVSVIQESSDHCFKGEAELKAEMALSELTSPQQLMNLER